jgi:hypothetical protein
VLKSGKQKAEVKKEVPPPQGKTLQGPKETPAKGKAQDRPKRGKRGKDVGETVVAASAAAADGKKVPLTESSTPQSGSVSSGSGVGKVVPNQINSKVAPDKKVISGKNAIKIAADKNNGKDKKNNPKKEKAEPQPEMKAKSSKSAGKNSKQSDPKPDNSKPSQRQRPALGLRSMPVPVANTEGGGGGGYCQDGQQSSQRTQPTAVQKDGYYAPQSQYSNTAHIPYQQQQQDNYSEGQSGRGQRQLNSNNHTHYQQGYSQQQQQQHFMPPPAPFSSPSPSSYGAQPNPHAAPFNPSSSQRR